MEIWTVTKLLDWTTDYLRKHNIEWPHLEAEVLLAYTLKLKRIELYTNHERILAQSELDLFKSYLQRRIEKEPIAYITNNQPFMSLDFYVDPSVMIPRPETELLVELIVDQLKPEAANGNNYLLADIGTGSGCIAVSLAKYLPNIKVTGIDASAEAIVIAHKNAVRHNVEERCEFKVGNLFEPLQEKVDIIISNPPYIKRKQIGQLAKDVRIWEPRKALDGGPEGLDQISKLLESAPDHLTADGQIFIEIGYDQGEAVRQLAGKTGHYEDISIKKDLNKKDRILYARVMT
jgi:release factor glutamine methyltransferase